VRFCHAQNESAFPIFLELVCRIIRRNHPEIMFILLRIVFKIRQHITYLEFPRIEYSIKPIRAHEPKQSICSI
jgi:hypothetical protein